MAELQVKTYMGKNPNGLLRVLFFAQEEDHKRFFDPITDQILKLYPQVAFYYSEDPKDISEEVLESMCLAVCPVTMAFLRKDCLARELLFSRVQEKHIALLPILEEEGIAGIFRTVCGKIQYLNAVKTDETALGFEHKLVTFLDDILLDTKTSTKIREAFDAYIFLSYRKKDRKHANDIMRIIHENPFMRDIAIWYDEYLVPGENYSEAIEQAILKSKLITLVVTPNLVNEENYVKSTEYPMVHREGKDVLPIQAEATDLQALKDSYEDLPEPVDISNPESVSKSLMERFSEEGMKENEDPQHLFYIGLAYLYGIDVEMNIPRAVELLEKSSDKGCVEASRKLISIYMEGHYVELDYYAAGLVLARLVVQLTKDKDSWDREKYLETIDYLRKIIKIMGGAGKVDNCSKVFRQAYDLAGEMDERFPDEWNELVRAGILVDCAGVLEPFSEQDNIADYLGNFYHHIFEIYMEYFEKYGYDTRWDLLPYIRPMAVFTEDGMDVYRWALDAGQGIGKMYYDAVGEPVDEEGVIKPAFLDLTYSFGVLINDYCNATLENFNDQQGYLQSAIRTRRINELLDYEKTLKVGTVLLAKGGRERQAVMLMQNYLRTFGLFYQKLGYTKEAKGMFENAFSILFDKYDDPEYIFEQIKNCRHLIGIGEVMEDKETQRIGHIALSEVLNRLYDATGAEIFKTQIDENEEIMAQKGLE